MSTFPATTPIKAPRIRSFCCPRCEARYVIYSRETAPGFHPGCETCNQDFVAKDQGDWLIYERADQD